ncbi:ATP-dependent helicase [Microbacterium sp. YY-01]|uniref:ATP-dependent helicase n=1 Tax=Microbacterium sp. YY-01 TaxID=3421634 RepID=UPI003D169CD5
MSDLRTTVDVMQADARQRDVIDAASTASAVVIGAPGTGKTHALVERVVRLIDSGEVGVDEVLVLTTSRHAATALRDRIGSRIAAATPGPLARSLGSFAFAVVRAEAARRGEEPPALLTGADQDRIIAELLAGDAEDEQRGQLRWPENLGKVVRDSRDFRSELRAFMAQCAELSVSDTELRAAGNDAWRAVADFTHDYRAVLDRLRSAHRDAAELLTEAATVLRSGAAGPFDHIRVVLVDDAQELTRGGVAVVEALMQKNVAVMAFGDPDISSGAFRGVSAELFAELADILRETYVLENAHRQTPQLMALTRQVTSTIGAAGRIDHRRPPEHEPTERSENGSIATLIADSPHDEIDAIAGQLRRWHLDSGIPWDAMAVVAHDTRQIIQLERELAAREVPTRAEGVQSPIGSEPIVQDILGVIRLALTEPNDRDVDDLQAALRSPFGGLDGVGLRRLRARLRQAELRDNGSSSARVLLIQAMAAPAQLTLIDAPEARAAERFARLLADLRSAVRDGETIHELLWLVWNKARTMHGQSLAQTWHREAAQPAGRETAHALDALVALFGAAKRFTERYPDEGPQPFIHQILDSEVPEDTLAAPLRGGSVALMTPATALGTEYDAVVVAGVNDGVWPNVRLRSELLQSWRLADAIHAARSSQPDIASDVVDRRRLAMYDELRLFVRAVSRARRYLLVTATSDDDHAASVFFRFLPDPLPSTAEFSGTDGHPLTLRGLVSLHRRTLTTSNDPQQRRHAAEQLAVLARELVPGADPSEWYGLAPTTTHTPLHDLGEDSVRVSPSQLERFERCALDWAIRSLGGEVSSSAAGIGTIVHAAMEKAPAGNLQELTEVLDERWGELEFEARWQEQSQRRWAELLVQRLHFYLDRAHRENVHVAGHEIRFRIDVDLEGDKPRVRGSRVLTPEGTWLSLAPGANETSTDDTHGESRPRARATISGSMDRVELYGPHNGEDLPAGSGSRRAVVIDLKTGRSENSFGADTIAEHAQLAAYQLAYRAGLGEHLASDDTELAGARLVVLSKTLKGSNYRIAHQQPMSDSGEEEFLQRIARVAHGMASSIFAANIDQHCTSDRYAVCTIHTIKAVSSS